MTQPVDDLTLWIIILALGLGSFLLRFSFLGFIGSRKMPDWLLRHLRYTAVAVLPALVAPLTVYSDGSGSAVSIGQICAGAVAVVLGVWTRSVFPALAGGAIVLTVFTLAFGPTLP